MGDAIGLVATETTEDACYVHVCVFTGEDLLHQVLLLARLELVLQAVEEEVQELVRVHLSRRREFRAQ